MRDIKNYFVTILTLNSIGGVTSRSCMTPTSLDDLDAHTKSIIDNPPSNKKIEIRALKHNGNFVRDNNGIIKDFAMV